MPDLHTVNQPVAYIGEREQLGSRQYDYLMRNDRKDGSLNLKIDDIPGAQPRRHMQVKGRKRGGFFPEIPEIERLLTKDKYSANMVKPYASAEEDTIPAGYKREV